MSGSGRQPPKWEYVPYRKPPVMQRLVENVGLTILMVAGGALSWGAVIVVLAVAFHIGMGRW